MIQQANEIAEKFAGFPRERAIEGIREHIERFCERAFGERLIEHVAKGGEGLHELVVEAVKRMSIET